MTTQKNENHPFTKHYTSTNIFREQVEETFHDKLDLEVQMIFVCFIIQCWHWINTFWEALKNSWTICVKNWKEVKVMLQWVHYVLWDKLLEKFYKNCPKLGIIALIKDPVKRPPSYFLAYLFLLESKNSIAAGLLYGSKDTYIVSIHKRGQYRHVR